MGPPVLVVLTLLVGTGAIVLGQETGSCQSFQDYVSEHPNCTSPGDFCVAIFCNASNHNYNFFLVNKCEDPVTVDVWVSASDFQHQYNRTETVFSDGTAHTAVMARNTSHLELEVYTSHGSETVNSVFDPIYIPLNASLCMCYSMGRIADEVDLDIGTDFVTLYNCTIGNWNCSQVVCSVVNSPLQSVNMTVHPCDSPPSIDLSLAVSGTAHLYNVDHSQRISSSGFEIEVDLWHYNYSMDVQIVVHVGILHHTVLPRNKIILDLTECSPYRPLPDFSGTTPTSIPTEPITPTTPPQDLCSALQSIASFEGQVCSTNEQCNALECEVAEQRVELAVLSCHNPPGVRVTVYNSAGQVAFNQSYYNGSHRIRPGSLPFSLIVTIRHISENAISLQVSVEFLTTQVQLIPETTIPIDRSSCSTVQPPTSSPSSTCEAMESIRQSLLNDLFPLSCNFPLEHNCTALLCPLGFEGDELLIKLLRCNHPPAIEVGVTDSNGSLTYYHVFDHSEEVTLDGTQGLNDTVLNVTLDELCSNEIGFKVGVVDGDNEFPLIPYTIIPVNTTGCGPSGSGVMCPSSTPGPFSTAATMMSSSSPTMTNPTGSNTHSPTVPMISSTTTNTGSKSSSPSSTSVPLPPPVFSSSCDAMQNISQQLQPLFEYIQGHCKTEGCNSVHCYGNGSSLTITVHCSEPLGFEIEERYSNGSVKTRLFTKSGPLYPDVNVTVDNVQNKRLGIAMYGYDVTLIEYTEVPIDSSACPSSSPASKSTSVILVASIVPVGVLVLLAVVVLIVIGVVMVKRKKGRGYHFHRMKFSEMEDEEED